MNALTYKPKEAIHALGIGRNRFYALIAAGELPHFRIGRSIRVPVEGLRVWVEERCQRTYQPQSRQRADRNTRKKKD